MAQKHSELPRLLVKPDPYTTVDCLRLVMVQRNWREISSDVLWVFDLAATFYSSALAL